MSKNEKRKAGEGKSDDLLTIDEAAALLDERPAQVRKLVSKGQIRNRRCCCRTARVRRGDLRELPVISAAPAAGDTVRDALSEIIALCQAVRSGEAKPRKTVARIEERAAAALQAATGQPPQG